MFRPIVHRTSPLGTLPHLLCVLACLVVLSGMAQQPGSVDVTFNPTDPGNGAGQALSNVPYCHVRQPDGKILIAGESYTYNTISSRCLVRVNTDGSFDDSFDVGAGADNSVQGIALQPDGKVLIVGTFVNVDGISRPRIARLNANGSVDTTFDPGTGANHVVYAVAVQADGKILIGGAFVSYNGTAVNRIARLNPDGSLDGTFQSGTGLDHWVHTILVQPDGKVLIGGSFTSYAGVSRRSVARLNVNGTLDLGFDPGTGANNVVFDMAYQPDGKVVIGGAFVLYNGTPRDRIARINANGGLDGTFDPGTGANGFINTLDRQPDGRILIGGEFTTFAGTECNRIARLNATGSLDTSFDTGGGVTGPVQTVGYLADGRVLIGGSFQHYKGRQALYMTVAHANGDADMGFNPGRGLASWGESILLLPDGKAMVAGRIHGYNGVAAYNTIRVNADGTLDESFQVSGTGIYGTLNALVRQADGKLVLLGAFSQNAGSSQGYILRLLPDGAWDASFASGTGANGATNAGVLLPDGKILIGGAFTSYNGVARNRIMRLNANGSLDTGFDPGSGADGTINALVVRSDGKILIGGQFTSYNGVARNRMALLNPNGTLDMGFDPGAGPNARVSAIAVQPDGRIMIGGEFVSVGSVSRSRIARLNADGTLDTTFQPGTGAVGAVNSIMLQANGKILVGGVFGAFNGIAQQRMARLHPNGSSDCTFTAVPSSYGTIYAMATRPDGKVLVTGTFGAHNAVGRNGLAVIHANELPAPVVTVGGSQTICALGTTAGLGGNTPTAGTGVWSIMSGAGTFSSTTAPNATFTHTGGSNVTLRWTVTNGCVSAYAEVEVIVRLGPPTVVVGPAQTVCAGSQTAVLGGSLPPAEGTGVWTVVSGGTGSFSPNANAPDARFTPDAAGTYILRWTLTNACASGFAQVAITAQVAPVSMAGPDVRICPLTTTPPLGATPPTSGIGTWSVISGGNGTFSPNVNDPNATFTHTTGTTNVTLRWTVTNSCGNAIDNTVVRVLQQPLVATVGPPMSVCASGTTTGLGGNTPPANGTGAWTVVSGGTGSFSNSTLPNATFSHGSGAGPFVLRWTVSYGNCTPVFADVTVTIDQPAGPASTGGSQVICVGGTSLPLGGNSASPGTGVWSVVSGGAGTFSDVNDPNATFTHTSGVGPILLRWTLSNGACTSSADASITITPTPSTATVGNARTICASTTTTGLGGNTPAVGTGAWSIVSGGTGTFSNASTPNATFTHTGGLGPVVLRWTITNGTCTSSADVIITITPAPTTATVGGPQTICASGTTAPLGGNTPLVGTGGWSIGSGSSGSGTFSAPNSPNSTFTHTSGTGPILLRWRIANGSCVSFNTVTLTITPSTVWYADADGDGAGDPTSTISACTQPEGYVDNGDDLCPLNGNKTAPGHCGCPNPEPGTPCDDGSQMTIEDAVNADCVCEGIPLGLSVNAKVFLEGPYDSATGLMNDALRTLPDFPTVDPHNGTGAVVSPALLAATGNNAIVDWVEVELRMALNPAIVFSSISALVQRDGDVVAVDGVSPVRFVWPEGAYHIAVRHRTHLGVMTAAPLMLGNTPTTIDFTLAATPTHGTAARVDVVGAFPAKALWAGDVNADGSLRYTGQNNDRDAILQDVGGAVPTNAVVGYRNSDVNLDGIVRYTGDKNDRDQVLRNIGGAVPTSTRAGQLP